MSATAEILTLPVLTKRCPDCEQTKPRADFYSAPVRKDGCSSYCKPCSKKRRSANYANQYRTYQRKYRKEKWRRLSPEERASKNAERSIRAMQFQHGLTMDQARVILARQGGLCGNRACGKDLSLDVHGRRDYWNRAVIDHCHTTGRVRGILCNPCNNSEGFYTKNKNLFLGIQEYLERSVT